MNKSILIVICDFFVLSVLSLSTGINPVLNNNDQYAGNVLVNSIDVAKLIQGLKEREKQLEDVEIKLEIKSLKLTKQESLLGSLNKNLQLAKEQNIATKKQLTVIENDNKNISKLLKNKIKESILNEKKLSIAESKKIATETEIAKKKSLIAAINEKNRKIKEKLAKIAESKKSLQNELGKRNTVLANKTSELYKLNKELNVLEQTAEKQEKEIKTKSQQLVTSKKEVGTLKKEVAKKEKDNKDFFNRLANTQGKLASTELKLKKVAEESQKLQTNLQQQSGVMKKYQKTITDKHNKLVRSTKALKSKEQQLTQTKSKLLNVKSELKTKDKKLAKVNGKLENNEKKLTKVAKQVGSLKDNLATTKSQLLRTGTILNKAMKSLQNDVLKSYAISALRMTYEINESGFFGNKKVKETLYYPEIAGKEFNYILADFNKLFNIPFGKNSSYSKVDLLKYYFTDADKPLQKISRLGGVVLSLKMDPRVCLVALPKRDRGLNMINRNDLTSRGLRNLYLFKAENYGQKSVILNGRCSLSLDKKDNYLYIRNDKKYPVNGNLNAEVGDFILSKEGEFVGLIVAINDNDSIAKCFIMPETLDLGASYRIPLGKSDISGKYYENFAKKTIDVSEKIKKLR